eukprot:m.157080 g.157080  ORF g.157080 m.157080 type:complete len:1321 (-) comp15161_c3_seq1:27-3989(-)
MASREDASRKRLSRITDILNMAKSGKLPAPDPLTVIEDSVVIEGLMHSSVEVRRRILDEINAGEANVVNMLGKFVVVLDKPDLQLQVFQDRAAALDSLSRLDLRGKQSAIPARTLKSLVVMLMNHLLGEDRTIAATAVRATTSLGLQNHVTLQLLEYIEQRAANERVGPALQGLRCLGVATPDVCCRVLAVIHHFTPTGLVNVQTGVSEQSCLECARELLLGFPQACFDDRVLAALEALIKDPKAASTRHHAPTQREHVITTCLTLACDKYAAMLSADQQQQEQARRAAEARLQQAAQGSRAMAVEELPEPSARSVLLGTLLSTVQDCLSDPAMPVRRAAARVMAAASVGEVLAKVLSHQVTMWLQGDELMRRAAIGNMVDLLFHATPTSAAAIGLLESENPRIRKLALVGINEFLVSPLLSARAEAPDASARPFASLLTVLHDYIEEIFADVIATDLTRPRCAIFTRQVEEAAVMEAAFDFVRTAGSFNHEAVCNAVMALEHESIEVTVSAAKYLACACLRARTNDRRPAATALQEIFGAAGNVALKDATIDTVVQLANTDLLAEGLEAFAVLCLDDSGDVRSNMRKKFFPRFLGEHSDPALAEGLRNRLVKVLLGRLINSRSYEEKLSALQVAGTVGRCDDTLVDVLLTLLESDLAEVRIAVLACLDAVRCTRPDAIAAGLRFVHSSTLTLRDAACIFAFNACVNGHVAVGVTDDGRAAIDAAVWHLHHETRVGREIEKVRYAAISLLRHAAAMLIRASHDASVKHDSLDIKDTIAVFLRGQSCRRDSLELQRHAWTLLTDFFAMDESDLALFTDCFSLSRSATTSAALGRDTYDRALMAELLPRVRVCSARDCSCLLESMAVDKLLAHLFVEPVLRYAQIPDRELPRDWGRMHAALRPRHPLVATLLAAEFTAAMGCAPPVVPTELQPRAPGPASKGQSRGAATSTGASAGPSAADTPAPHATASAVVPSPAAATRAGSAIAQAMAASAGLAAGVGVTGAPVLMRNAVDPAAAAAAESLAAAERRVHTLEKTVAALNTQLGETREKLAGSQKVGRDERRARLLLEERCRELSSKLKHTQTKLQKMEEMAAAAPAPTTPAASAPVAAPAAAAALQLPPKRWAAAASPESSSTFAAEMDAAPSLVPPVSRTTRPLLRAEAPAAAIPAVSPPPHRAAPALPAAAADADDYDEPLEAPIIPQVLPVRSNETAFEHINDAIQKYIIETGQLNVHIASPHFNGFFTLRTSDRRANQKVVSFVFQGKVFHYDIVQSDDGVHLMYAIAPRGRPGLGRLCRSLVDLVTYCRANIDVLPCKLTRYIP